MVFRRPMDGRQCLTLSVHWQLPLRFSDFLWQSFYVSSTMPSALYTHWHLTVSSQKSAHYSKKKNPASPLRCRILFNSNHRQYLLHMHRFLENQPRTLHRKYLPVFLLQIHTSSGNLLFQNLTRSLFFYQDLPANTRALRRSYTCSA